METAAIKVMRGPNYWSNDAHRLIELKLTGMAGGELTAPSLEKLCSELARVLPALPETTLTDPVTGERHTLQTARHTEEFVLLVAAALQEEAGMACSHGGSYTLAEPGARKVVFSYLLENAGTAAAHAAVEGVRSLLGGGAFDAEGAVTALAAIYKEEAIGPSTQSIIDEAQLRGIPFARISEGSLIRLGQGKNQRLFEATVMETTSSIAVDIVGSKWMTKKLLSENGIPVPAGIVVEEPSELDDAILKIGYPLVIKPVDGNHGRGITAGITDRETAETAFALAHEISDSVIVENYINGDDYRFLVINYKLIAVAKRTPAMVTGDGKSTIRELIAAVNTDPDRGTDHEKILTQISVDEYTLQILAENDLTLESVPEEGRELYLKRTANLSTGGTATDVTDTVHPANVQMAERIARLMHLDVCGIDIMAKDVTVPMKVPEAAVIEVNAGPGFRMHTHPSEGQPRNVAKAVIDMLFPDDAPGRIPVVAVTGTNGKTTTVRLIAHLAQQLGFTAGFTTTEGIYIGGNLVVKGDCSGPKSAEVVLSDPGVDFAVLECARGGILRSGLAFDHCNISVVTNVSEDHLGLNDIHTMEEYARVKEVVPRSTFPDGYAILNADDDRVYAMKERLTSNVVLFGTDSKSPRLTEHCTEGGITVSIEDDWYVICDSGKTIRVIAVSDIPLTENGNAVFMVKNIFPAIAAAYVSGFDMEKVRTVLSGFKASPELTPGRMNLFDFGDFRLMLDYAHNAGGFSEIATYLEQVDATRKVGIVAATGDRKNDDIIRQGTLAAGMFDEIIIRHDLDDRGRDNDEMTELLRKGITDVDPEIPITVISDEAEAIGHAIRNATPGTFIFTSADAVFDSIGIIKGFHESHTSGHSERAGDVG